MRPTLSNQAARRQHGPASLIPGTAVQVCVDYADVLGYTLPRNRLLFERYIIVTAPHDMETQEICGNYDVELVVSDRFWRDGAFFNKAAGLNEGLRHAATDLVCSLDADTILPTSVPHHVACIDDRESLYGMARKIHLTYADYLTDTGEIRATGPGYTIGFFQLFWRSSAFFPGAFAESYSTAAHYDIEFMAHWPAGRRKHLGDLVASHIGPRQINWFGRHSHAPQSSWTTARETYERFIGKITALRSSRQLLIQNVGSRSGANVVIDIRTGSDKTQICLAEIRGGGFVEVPINLIGANPEATLRWSDSSGERFCADVPVDFR